jgi:hypothetical protein
MNFFLKINLKIIPNKINRNKKEWKPNMKLKKKTIEDKIKKQFNSIN